MAQIHNSEIIKNLIDKAKIQTSVDAVPNRLAEKIVPVMEVDNQKKYIRYVIKGEKNSSGSYTVYTTPEDDDFYITNMILSWTNDAVADNTDIGVEGVPKDNLSAEMLMFLLKQTTTAGTQTQTLNFNPPLLMTKDSDINLLQFFTAGTSKSTLIIYGYKKLKDTLY